MGWMGWPNPRQRAPGLSFIFWGEPITGARFFLRGRFVRQGEKPMADRGIVGKQPVIQFHGTPGREFLGRVGKIIQPDKEGAGSGSRVRQEVHLRFV